MERETERETYSAVCVRDCLHALLFSAGRGSSWAGALMTHHAFGVCTSVAHHPAMLFPTQSESTEDKHIKNITVYTRLYLIYTEKYTVKIGK